MSVPYDILLAMDNWYKKTYVCTICDALIEMTTKSDILRDKNCFECQGMLNLLSVEDATIYPTTKKEEQNMDTMETSVRQELELTMGNEITELKNQLYALQNKYDSIHANLSTKQNEWYKKESQLRTLLEEVYADSQDQENLLAIAEIFDVPLTKEIEVTAWVRVSATIEVDLAEGDYDLEDMIRNNLTVDSYGSEISVNDYDVERVEEGLY